MAGTHQPAFAYTFNDEPKVRKANHTLLQVSGVKRSGMIQVGIYKMSPQDLKLSLQPSPANRLRPSPCYWTAVMMILYAFTRACLVYIHLR